MQGSGSIVSLDVLGERAQRRESRACEAPNLKIFLTDSSKKARILQAVTRPTWQKLRYTNTGMPSAKPARYLKSCSVNSSAFFSLSALKKSRPKKLKTTLRAGGE